MNPRSEETNLAAPPFDFYAFPDDTLFLDRRTLPDRRGKPGREPRPEATPAAPKARKERRRRVDPTTFEKQYSPDEIEFMNAIQDFKNQSGKAFPSHGDVLRVALRLGYRQPFLADDELETPLPDIEPIPVAAVV